MSSVSSFVATGIRDELTQGRSGFFDLLLGCTVLIAVGVLLEEADSWFPIKKSTTKLARIGWLLILLGVIGEGVFEAAVSWADTAIQDFNDTLLTVTTEQANNAAQSAETARQDAEVIREQLSDTSRIAAEARLKLKEYVDTVAERQFDRRLDSKKFVELLKGKPKARVEVLYDPNDLEAWDFALDIYEWLGTGAAKTDVAAGWDVSPPEPIASNVNRYGLINAPPAVRLGASGSQSGISFITNDISLRPDSPLESLGIALTASTLPSRRGTSWMSTEDKLLPDGLIVVVVGPKPSWLWGLQRQTRQKNSTAPKTR